MHLCNYKYRLYPTREQETKLEETLDGCMGVYNYFVSNGFSSEYDMNYTILS
ncbi:MAG: helix-turn-helix domain-containing protein [Nitrososphaera sp.]